MNEVTTRELGWGRFILQFLTVAVVYFAASIPAAIIWGEVDAAGELVVSSTGAAVSVASSMAGALLMAWFWLRRDNAVAQAWNLRSPTGGWPITLGVAALATIAIIGWFTLGAMLVQQIGLDTPDVVEVLGWVTQSQFHFILWIVLVALFAAGLGEELLWRGFLMDRLERLPGLGGKAWLIILIQGILFGLPHAYQGLGGVIITGVVGLGLGWLRYNRKGNLWALVIAHMAVDVIMMSLAYADKLGAVQITG
ncbi:CPBP family intramembrane glutamic endopeptidase [Qipengyuania sphaerica]|uniref:CPBP family intramembrane glutamic endopeptidase n=1 Tax=Qipengyuania sphaerica TaxID=2867243 RepID=UPI001C88C11E|nr:type II CAAX endopeptidase family protein [Qipengyuania sphaerica]MBX7539811.1 CPBP family intramembrane metalloprotease [Qipengyuania sphaerica]